MKTRLFLIIVLVLLTGFLSAQDNKAPVALAAAIYEEEVTGNLDKAVELYLDILKKYPDERPVGAKTLYHLGLVNEKMGKKKANEYFTRLINTYPDQTEIVALAKARMAALGSLKGTSTASGFVARRILTDATGVNGTLTADGKYIRYLDRHTGDVVQFEIVTGQTSRIKNKFFLGEKENMVYIEGYVFSRDGKQIAYDWDTIVGKPQLRIRNLDGSNLHSIHDKSYTIPLDWSPDAGSILALGSVTDKKNEIVLISTKDNSVRVLKNFDLAPYALTGASFSPNGLFIAYSLVNDGKPPQGEVYLMNADGSNEVVVAAHPAEDELLGWAPDGKSLLFISDRSGTWDMWTVGITGEKQHGEPQLLKKDFGKDSKFLGFAPDGSLYYKTVTPLGHLYFGEIDIETGKVLVPPSPVITRFNGPPSRLIWSPDGSSLLYVSGGRLMGNGNNKLTIRDTESGEERFLSTSLRNVWDIYWAPDSHTILASGMTVKENALFRIDTETSMITRLASGRWAPRLSPDMKTMFYMGYRGITKRNLDTGEESVGVKAGTKELKIFDDLSPDCKEAVFQEKGTVYTVPLNGGEKRELFNGLSHYCELRWARDGQYIIAMALDDTSGWYLPISEIWRIPAQGGTSLKLDLSISKMEYFALHPDNRHFAFSVNEGTSEELWVLENFMPK